MKLHNKIKPLSIFLLVSLFCTGAYYFYSVCYKRHYLTIAAPINDRDGIGRQAIDLLLLLGDEIDTNIIFNIKFSYPSKIEKYISNMNKKPGYVVLNEHTLLETNIPMEEYKNKFLLSDQYKYRNFVNQIPREEQIYINYSMFEADAIPQDSVYNFNKHWDMIVVPDKNLVEIYKKSGITIPIFVVPLGVRLEDHLKAKLKTQRNKIFKFANFSVFEERKNLLKLVQAFHLAFHDKQDVRLLLSARGMRGNTYKEVIGYIIKNNLINIEVDKVSSKEDDYLNFLLTRIDCYVSPSKGEGFSIIPRETMARGIPTIVSDSIAQKTIADTGLVSIVPAKKLVPGNYLFINRIVGNFNDIETYALALAMLDVYNNYQKYLNLAPQARAWAQKNQYKSLKKLYINMLKPKRVILGDHNEITEEYLMTNSQILYKKWKHLEDIGELK